MQSPSVPTLSCQNGKRSRTQALYMQSGSQALECCVSSKLELLSNFQRRFKLSSGRLVCGAM